jgi:hypothetical protein
MFVIDTGLGLASLPEVTADPFGADVYGIDRRCSRRDTSSGGCCVIPSLSVSRCS